MTIVIYTRRNVGLYAVSYFKAKGFRVKVISDDHWVQRLAFDLGAEEVWFDTVGEFDLFLCVHGTVILSEEYLSKGLFVNVHPCIKYKGKNPIARYIKNKDALATIDAHYMTPEVDAGDIVASIPFATGEVGSYAEFYNQAVPFYFILFGKILEELNLNP